MSSNVKRILISFLISLLGIAGTYFYFQKINPILIFNHNQKPLAQIENLENVSRKKLAEHRTWQVVEYGDPLYSGEMIKTSSDSELQIRFLETNAILNMEPDSAITIQKSKNRISISLVEGNLFIDSLKSGEAQTLAMESDQGPIDLAGASVKFSKNNGLKLHYNLLSGRAIRIDENGKTIEIKNDNSDFVILSPLNLSSIETLLPEVRLKWKSKIETKRTELIFKTGANRSSLKVVIPQFIAQSEVVIPARFGKNIIEIFSKNAEGMELEISSVRFQLKPSLVAIANPAPKPVIIPVVVEKPKPQIVWLGDSSELQPFATQPEISLNWLVKNKELVKKVKIQILDGHEIVISKEVSAADTAFKTFVKKPGRYTASVEAFDADAKSLAQSTLRPIVAEEFPFLPIPKWTRKDALEKAELNGSFSSSWSEMPGALNYKLVLKDANGRIVKQWIQKRTYFVLKGLLPGQYTLSLAAIDLYQRESIQKAIKNIEVLDNSEILAPKLKRMRFK